MPTTPKPLVIITPLHASHIQSTIHCSKKHGLQIRIRSGGHDYEGISYVLCLEQQLTIENKSYREKLERETRDLCGSTNYLRLRERESDCYYYRYIIGLQ